MQVARDTKGSLGLRGLGQVAGGGPVTPCREGVNAVRLLGSGVKLVLHGLKAARGS